MQKGITRINCIDWLDRTNYSMTFLAAWALYRQIISFMSLDSKGDFTQSFSTEQAKYISSNLDMRNKWVKGEIMVNLSKIYSKNGDAISRQYWGSKAMHGAKMSMNNDGELKLEKRKKNALIYTKRLMNNTFGIDMKKQSALSLVTGHFKFYDVKVHPWTIDFAAADINFDHHMNNSNPLDLEEIFDEHAKKVRELELEQMFSSLI